MKLDNFKLAAMQKAAKTQYKYELIKAKEQKNFCDYIIKFQYKSTQIYFQIECFSTDIIDNEMLSNKTQKEIEKYEKILTNPDYLSQVRYLDRKAKLIFAKQREQEGGMFTAQTINKIEEKIDALLDTNKNNFEKTYSQLANEKMKQEIFGI